MRTMLVAPGVPSGTPATMMMRWPGLGEALAEREACRRGSPCRRGRARRRSTTAMHAPDDREAASRREVRRDRDDRSSSAARARRGRRSSRRTSSAAMAGRSSVSAIWRAASAIASAPVASGSVRCAWMIDAIGRVALDLLGDAVHRRRPPRPDTARRRFPPRASRRPRPRRSAVATSGDFGARRHRIGDHRLQHLRRDHHGLAGARAPRA